MLTIEERDRRKHLPKKERDRLYREDRDARLSQLGCRGVLPVALTDAVIVATRRKPLGEAYTLPDGEVPGLSVHVGKSGAGSFWLHYRVNGARRRQKVGSTSALSLVEARARARKLLVKVDDGQDPLALARREAETQRTVRRYLLEIYAPMVLSQKKDGGVPKDGGKPGGTYARILYAWEKLLDVPLRALTPDAISDVLIERKSRLAPTTVKRDWNPLRKMLKHAAKRKAIPAELAADLLERPEPLENVKDRPRRRFLGDDDPAERPHFLAALKEFQSHEPGGGEYVRVACTLALNCGLREGEVVQLRDDMIRLRDVGGERIELPGDVCKGGKGRTLDLNPDAIAAIKRWLDVRKTFKVQTVGGALFPGDPNHWKARLKNQNRDFHKMCRAAKISDLTFHDLRRTFASLHVQGGTPLIEVQKMLGHASLTTTEKHYAYLAKDAGKERARAFRIS